MGKEDAELIKKTFVERLKTLMKKRDGMSQTMLAKALGVTDNSVSRYINGNNLPDVSTLCKIAELFDVTVDYLVGRAESASQQPPKTFLETVMLIERLSESRFVRYLGISREEKEDAKGEIRFGILADEIMEYLDKIATLKNALLGKVRIDMAESILDTVRRDALEDLGWKDIYSGNE